MNTTPPTDDDADDLEAVYRKTAAQDLSRPSVKTRQVILEHAAQIAADRSKLSERDWAAARRAADGARPADSASKWRRRVFAGSLAAAVIAALIVGPQFLRSSGPMPPAPTEAASTLADQKPLKSTELAEVTVTLAKNSAPAAENVPKGASRPRVYASPSQAVPSAATAVAANTGHEESRASADAAASRAATAPPAADEQEVIVTGARVRKAPDATRSREVSRASGLSAQDSSRPVGSSDASGAFDVRDAQGRTALMRAVVEGHLDAVVTLLGRGADPNAVDAAGMTPLQAARAGKDPRIADALLHAGAH